MAELYDGVILTKNWVFVRLAVERRWVRFPCRFLQPLTKQPGLHFALKI